MPIPQTETDLFFEGIDCPACGRVALEGFDPNRVEAFDSETLCSHVFMRANDVGLEYLSAMAISVLETRGATVDVDGGFVEVELAGEELNQAEVLDLLASDGNFTEAKVLAVYAPAPVFNGAYVGLLSG